MDQTALASWLPLNLQCFISSKERRSNVNPTHLPKKERKIVVVLGVSQKTGSSKTCPIKIFFCGRALCVCTNTVSGWVVSVTSFWTVVKDTKEMIQNRMMSKMKSKKIKIKTQAALL